MDGKYISSTGYSVMTQGLPPIRYDDSRNFVPCRRYSKTKPITGKRVQKIVATDDSKRENEHWKPTDRLERLQFDGEVGINEKTCIDGDITKKIKELLGDESEEVNSILASERFCVRMLSPLKSSPRRDKLGKPRKNIPTDMSNRNDKKGHLDMTEGLPSYQNKGACTFVPCKEFNRTDRITGKILDSNGRDGKEKSTKQERCTDSSKRKSELRKSTEKSKKPADMPANIQFDVEVERTNEKTCTDDAVKKENEFPKLKRKYVEVDHEGGLPKKRSKLKNAGSKPGNVQTNKDGPAPLGDTPPWAAILVEMGLLEPSNKSSPIFLPPRRILGPK